MAQVPLKKGLQLIGRGRKGVGTKLHLALSQTKVQGTCLSEAQVIDTKAFNELFAKSNWQDTQYIVADKAYDCLSIKTLVVDSGRTTVIPRRSHAAWSAGQNTLQSSLEP